MRCTGKEMSLVECGHRGWGVHNCAQYQKVSIICNNSKYEHLVWFDLQTPSRNFTLNGLGIWDQRSGETMMARTSYIILPRVVEIEGHASV